MFTNKIRVLLFLCMLTSGLYAERILVYGDVRFSDSARDQTIQKMLFGEFSLERKQYIYQRPTDHEIYTWYFFEKDDYFQSLALFVHYPDNPKKDYVFINTSHDVGPRCLIASGRTIYDRPDPVLYFWDGEESIEISEAVNISYRTDRGTCIKKIFKGIQEIEIADFSKEGYGKQELHSIEGFENFPRLEKIIVSYFTAATPHGIKYSRAANLVFKMCGEVSM